MVTMHNTNTVILSCVVSHPLLTLCPPAHAGGCNAGRFQLKKNAIALRFGSGYSVLYLEIVHHHPVL